MKKILSFNRLTAFRCAAGLFALIAAAVLPATNAHAQDGDWFVRIISVDSTIDGVAINTVRTPSAQFDTDINETVTVTFQHDTPFVAGVLRPWRAVLLEDEVIVAEVNVIGGFSTSSQLSYIPTSAGISSLRVVIPEVTTEDEQDGISDSIELRKIGISLNEPEENDLLPVSSSFFVNGSAFLPDSFLRNIAFYTRLAPGPLREDMPYLEGDKVLGASGLIYQAINSGELSAGSIDASGGLTTENPDNVTTISGVGFRYVGPNLIDQHVYNQGDFVISNGRLYRVSSSGRLKSGEAAVGLLSSVESEDDAPVVEFLESEVGFRYKLTPRSLVSGMSLSSGDYVTSGTRRYEVIAGGSITTASPVLLGTNPNVPLFLDGVEFRFRNTKVFRSNAPYFEGELVRSGDYLFDVVFSGTTASGSASGGLAVVSGVQLVDGNAGFTYVADAVNANDPDYFPRQYHKYINIGVDNATPFTTPYSPQDYVDDASNWFGPDGFYEANTEIEVFALATDSKDFSRLSPAVPISLLPAIDPGAEIVSEIINPTSGRVYSPNTLIQISAQGKDGQEIANVVTGVQFFINGIPLDIPDGTFPYTADWVPTVAGTYVINSVVLDPNGNRTVSEDVSVNITDNRPFVELRNPLGTSFQEPEVVESGDSFQFTAYAQGSGGVLSRISGVELFSDGNSLGGATFSAGGWTLDATFGTLDNFEADRVYTITAVATDVNGLTATSTPEYIVVNPDNTDKRPFVELRNPVDTSFENPQEVVSGNSFELAAYAQGSGGALNQIASVNFFSDNTLIGAATINGTLGRWTLDTTFGTSSNSDPNRVYTITAVATDINGLTSTSAQEYIVVSADDTNKRPFVELRNPLGTSFQEPQVIESGEIFQLVAYAQGSGGLLSSITSVVFYSDDVAFGSTSGEGESSGATFNDGGWTLDAIFGTLDSFDPNRVYTITAVATDANGLSTTSAPEYIVLTPDDTDNKPFVELRSPTNTSLENPQQVVSGDIFQFAAYAQGSGGSLSSITSVDIYSDDSFLDTATFDALSGIWTVSAQFGTSYNFEPNRVYEITAVALDVNGIRSTSAPEYIVVNPVDAPVITNFEVDRTEATVSQPIELSLTATSEDLVISRVEFFANGERIGFVTDAASGEEFVFIWEPTAEGEFVLTAQASDQSFNSTTVTGPTVSISPFDPTTNDENFVDSIFDDLIGRSPTDQEIADALVILDGTFESRVELVESYLYGTQVETSEIASIIFRTMIGAWPDSEELDAAREALLGSSNSTQTLTGNIAVNGTQSFPITLTTGASVVATVVPDTAAANPLNDPTLAVVAPSGVTIAFNDDTAGLNPQVSFVANTPGIYNLVVAGFSTNSGAFIMNVDIQNSGGGTINPNALTTALVPAYEVLYGALNTQVGFVRQTFINKHGVSPNAQSEVRLLNSLQGTSVTLSNDQVIPGYGGDTISYITQFALDNDVSGFRGPSGAPLSNIHLYAMPNDPTAVDLPLALAIATLLGVSPTDELVAEYAALPLDEAIGLILVEYLDEYAAATLPTAFSDASSLGDGWYSSDWFGSFASDSSFAENWIYSSDFGWIYVSPSGTTSGVWLFSLELNTWIWGSPTLNRFFYRWDTSTWVWALTNQNGSGVWLYDLSSDSWELVQP